MTDVSPLVLLALFALVLAVVATVRLRSQPDGRSAPLPIAGGAPSATEEIQGQLVEIQTTLANLHEAVLRRPPGALPLGTEKPKEHRPQFVLNSEERTNKVIRRIYTCRVPDCPDTLIDEEPEPMHAGGPS